MYKPNYGKDGKCDGVTRLTDGAFIPRNVQNNHYREFLAWQDLQAPEKKIDLSDKLPEQPTPDAELPTQQRLVDYLKLDPQAVTQAQREAALRAVIRLVLRRENVELDKGAQK